MDEKSFAQYEREGWESNAAAYDEILLPATSQAFAPLLDSVGNLDGRRVLELASGTGHLAEQVAARGATVVGVDVAPSMVALARRRVAGATFQEGAAEALPFEDEQFDVVLCAFGLLHFAQPAQALVEAARVLRPGGICAFTVWYGPDRGSDFFRLILSTYQAHANMDVGLPPAPPLFGLADPAVRDPMLKQAGFEEIQTRDLAIAWPLRGAETLQEFVVKGSVRTRMLYDWQTPQVQQRIGEALVAATAPYLRDGKAGIPAPAVLVTARKMF